MTQQQWDLIGYGVWALIIWMTFKQFRQTRKEVEGSGKKLLWGDWLLFAPLPWIIYCMADRATIAQVLWTIAIGVALAIPYVLTTRFEIKANGCIQFKSNRLFYLFLFGFPIVRYFVRDHIFKSNPILFPNHMPDIELMLAHYIAALVIFTFVWRLSMYLDFIRTAKRAEASNKQEIAA